MKYLQNHRAWIPTGIIGAIIAAAYIFWLRNVGDMSSLYLAAIFVYLWALFGLVTYFIWRRVIKPRLASYSTRWVILWSIGCLLAGLWLADNIPLVYPGSATATTAIPFIHKILFLGTSGFALGALLFLFSVILAASGKSSKMPGQRKLRWLIYASPMLISWGVYLLAYWPGMMSADSIDQWGQVLTGQFTDHHPAFHTFLIWLLTRITLSPAIVALAQVIALALVAGAILAYFEYLGIRPVFLWAASAVMALSPVNGTMVNTLWKDIPYSTALLAFSFLVFKLAQSQGKWLSLKRRWLILGITAALVTLIRYNGPPVILGTFLLLLIIFHQQWKPLVFSAVLAAGLFFGIRGPVFQLVHVAPSTALVEGTTSLYAIAAHSSPGTETASILASISPVSLDWNCSITSQLDQAYRSDPAQLDPDLSQEIVDLAAYSPNLMTYYYRCLRSLVWIVWDPNGKVYDTSHVINLDDPNPYGIAPDSKIPYIRTVISQFVTSTATNTGINWLVWRPALYLYVYLFIIAIMALRYRDARFLQAAIPILLQSVESTIIVIAPNFRYHYAAYLLALIFWPVLFSPRAKPAETETQDQPVGVPTTLSPS